MFAQLTLRARLLLIVLAAFVGMAILASLSAYSAKTRLMEDHKALVRAGVQGIYNAVADLQRQETEGKISRDEAQRLAKELIRAARYGGNDGKSEYYYAWTMEGVAMAHVKREIEGQNMLDKIKDAQGRYTIRDIIESLKSSQDAFVDTQFPRPGQTEALPKLQYVMKFPAWNWLIGTGIYTDDIETEFRGILLGQLGTALVLALFIGAMSFVLAHGVLKQIGGEPNQAAEVMRRVASGDLTASLGNAPAGSLLGALDTMVKSLRELIREVRSHADTLVSNAEQIKRASDEVASAAEQQSDATSAMASAIEELTVSSNHISDSARETESDSREAMSLANTGSQRVEEATHAIQQIASTVSDASNRIQALEQRAEQVSSIANVIKDIAGQTNLLALNAAIEAARAGEQGRGFAVVADEVRKLAERTSLATTEIEQTITGIQSETGGAVAAMSAALPEVEQGVQLASSASESLRGIESGAQRTLERVAEVASATREQSTASTSIAQRVEDIAQRVEQTSETIRETAASANNLELIAQDLMQQIARFKV